MADKVSGFNNYANVVQQVAAQRIARLGPAGAMALTQPMAGVDPTGYTKVGPNIYGPPAAPPVPASQDTSGGGSGFGLGSALSSGWHALLEGVNRAGSIVPDIMHEQDALSQQRKNQQDTTHKGSSGYFDTNLGHLGGDVGAGFKGIWDALSGKNRDFSQQIQEIADIAKANQAAQATNKPRPEMSGVKSGSAYVNPYFKGWAGAAGDIVANPLNLVGAGTVAKGAKLADEGLAGLRTAKIAAPVAKKQIALKLAGANIPTGIPAAQIGARMAASSSPAAQKIVEAFRPVGNWINNPELKSSVQNAKGSADAFHYQYVHKTLAPMFGHLSPEQQKSVLSKVYEFSKTSKNKLVLPANADKEVLAAHGQINHLAQILKDSKVTAEQLNYHLPKVNNLVYHDAHSVDNLNELHRLAGLHSGGVSDFLSSYHGAAQKAIEHKGIVKLFPSQSEIRPLSKALKTDNEQAKAQAKYLANLKSEGFVKHSSPFLQGRMIHSSLVPQYTRAENLLRNRGNYMGSKWYARALDKSNSLVKKIDVGLNPASTARRVLSFTNQQLINGHFNPQMLQKALAVNLRHHELYRNVDSGSIEGLGAGKFIKVGKERIPTNEIFAEASKRGVFGNFVRSEVRNAEEKAGKRLPSKIGNKLLEKSFNANEHVDNTFRMGTFLDAIQKAPKGLTKDQVYAHAMNEVRKTHLDFSGLTPFERKYMTRIFPFYAAISRSTPIAYRQLLANPGGVAKLPIAQRDFGQSFGDHQNPGAIPSYLLNNGASPVGFFKGQPVMLDQKNDVTDAYQQFMANNPWKTLTATSSQATPVIKDPLELLLGKNLFTGAPTHDKPSDLASYAASQTPLSGIASRMVKEGNPPGGKTNWPIDPTLLRLAGVGTNVVTPKQQKSAQKNANKKHPWYDLVSKLGQ